MSHFNLNTRLCKLIVGMRRRLLVALQILSSWFGKVHLVQLFQSSLLSGDLCVPSIVTETAHEFCAKFQWHYTAKKA
jgi:hypothetical protein